MRQAVPANISSRGGGWNHRGEGDGGVGVSGWEGPGHAFLLRGKAEGRKDSKPQETKRTTDGLESLEKTNIDLSPISIVFNEVPNVLMQRNKTKRNGMNRNLVPMQLWRYFGWRHSQITSRLY